MITHAHEFTAGEAMGLAGCNYTFLNNLARTGLLTPSIQPAAGKGSTRLYSFSDVLALRIVRQMREAGFELQELKGWIDWLRTPDLPAAIEADPAPYQYLLSWGQEVRPVSLEGLRSVFGPQDPVPLYTVLNLRAIVAELRAALIVMMSLKAGL
jgi:DNA-binding transcriptional MerR regulator